MAWISLNLELNTEYHVATELFAQQKQFHHTETRNGRLSRDIWSQWPHYTLMIINWFWLMLIKWNKTHSVLLLSWFPQAFRWLFLWVFEIFRPHPQCIRPLGLRYGALRLQVHPRRLQGAPDRRLTLLNWSNRTHSSTTFDHRQAYMEFGILSIFHLFPNSAQILFQYFALHIMLEPICIHYNSLLHMARNKQCHWNLWPPYVQGDSAYAYMLIQSRLDHLLLYLRRTHRCTSYTQKAQFTGIRHNFWCAYDNFAHQRGSRSLDPLDCRS